MAARKPKPSTKKRKRRSAQMTDPAQSARFLEMAKKLEADESGESFERAMEVLAPKNKRK